MLSIVNAENAGTKSTRAHRWRCCWSTTTANSVACSTEYLVPEGFKLTVVHDGDEALYTLGRRHFDLIVLDVMLPRTGGLDVLRLLRQKLATPVLMLTARGEDVDRVVGLELGADDYLPKPFNPRELVARMRAILRRSLQIDPQPGRRERLDAGPISLHFGSRTASARGQTFSLTGANSECSRY